MHPTRRRIRGWLRSLALMVLGVLLAGLWFLVVEVRGRADLAAWHRLEPEGEWTAKTLDESVSLAAYREGENRLFAGVVDAMKEAEWPGNSLNRFDPASATNPARHPRDWNRTYELGPELPRGGALLLHGLSDSPYSVRGLAEILADGGYYALGLRLPGHGTVPGGLRHVSWRDWRAAVGVGVRAVRSRSPEGPLVLAGYSNGAALALDYTLAALDDPELPVPDRLILLSPAMAVSPLASLATWQRRMSHLPGLEKLAWNSIVPEFDPYKYNSFAINAAEQIHRLTAEVERALERKSAQGKLADLPRILSFQSVADATVPAKVSLTRIYGRLPANESELVLFDVNRVAEIEDLLQPHLRELVAGMREAGGGVSFSLTLLSNAGADSRAVAARTWAPGAPESLERLELSWPSGVYSLSHVAVPFPPRDPVYGLGMELGDPFPFGLLEPKGERGTLQVPITLLTRLRFNPFFGYLEIRVQRFLGIEPDDPA